MSTFPKLMFSEPAAIRAFRKNLNMNQAQFWQRAGITQSGGSRYESSGRSIPETVQLLLHLAYAPDARAQRLFDALRTWKTDKPPAKRSAPC